MVGRDRIGSEYYTDTSPEYPFFSDRTAISIGVASVLIVATLGLMWLFRGTMWAEETVWLFRDAPLAPWIGIAVFGVLLTGGRYFGLKAAVTEQYALAFLASAVVGVAYAAFGAGVMLLYPSSIHGSAILVTAALTTVLTITATAVVYTTDHSFVRWDRYSGVLMIAGIVVSFFGVFWLTFVLILLGWIVDLVFEIYMVSSDGRSPVANGIGVYVAFMGVFIHLLQIVLELMSEAD